MVAIPYQFVPPVTRFDCRLSEVRNDNRSGINSVEHALELLVHLSRRESVGVSEVASLLGIAPSSAHRLLATFCDARFAVQGSNRRYGRGPAFVLLGDGNLPTTEMLRKLLTPTLEEMARELEETAHLVVLEGCFVRFLNSVEANRPLRVSSRAGRLLPAHRTSCGRILLCDLSDEEVSELYRTESSPVADEVLGDFDSFLKKLDQTRKQGFGLNHGESEAGVVAISACVRTRSGKGIAALSLSMPSVRLDDLSTPEMARQVKLFAEKAADSLGIAI